MICFKGLAPSSGVYQVDYDIVCQQGKAQDKPKAFVSGRWVCSAGNFENFNIPVQGLSFDTS